MHNYANNIRINDEVKILLKELGGLIKIWLDKNVIFFGSIEILASHRALSLTHQQFTLVYYTITKQYKYELW